MTFVRKLHRLIGAIEKAPLEQLDGDYSEYKLEEEIDDENVEDVLQRVHHAIENGLKVENRIKESFCENVAPTELKLNIINIY